MCLSLCFCSTSVPSAFWSLVCLCFSDIPFVLTTVVTVCVSVVSVWNCLLAAACVLSPCTCHLDGQGLLYVCVVPLYLSLRVCDYVLPLQLAGSLCLSVVCDCSGLCVLVTSWPLCVACVLSCPSTFLVPLLCPLSILAPSGGPMRNGQCGWTKGKRVKGRGSILGKL